jgi:hypothetical protein
MLLLVLTPMSLPSFRLIGLETAEKSRVFFGRMNKQTNNQLFFPGRVIVQCSAVLVAVNENRYSRGPRACDPLMVLKLVQSQARKPDSPYTVYYSLHENMVRQKQRIKTATGLVICL